MSKWQGELDIRNWKHGEIGKKTTGLDTDKLAILNKLMTECARTIKISCKIIKHGAFRWHPLDSSMKFNIDNFEDKLADLQNAINRCGILIHDLNE